MGRESTGVILPSANIQAETEIAVDESLLLLPRGVKHITIDLTTRVPAVGLRDSRREGQSLINRGASAYAIPCSDRALVF